MARVSASKSALLLSPCLRWAGDVRDYEDEFADTTKRDKGVAFHSHMDAYYSGKVIAPGKFTDDDAVRSWAKDAVAWSKAHLEPLCETIQSEVYIASNYASGQLHTDPSVHDRQYPDLPGYVPGTADLVCVLKSGELYVADWKTGGGTGAREQLMSLAWGLRNVRSIVGMVDRDVVLAILYAGANGVRPHEWKVTKAELEAHGVAMAFQLANIPEATGAVPGIHCTQLYCNHLAYCPGISSTVEAASESPQGLLPAERLVRRYEMSAEPTSNQHAGAIMERVTAAKRQLDFYEKRIKRYIENGGRAIAGDFEFSKGRDGFRWRAAK